MEQSLTFPLVNFSAAMPFELSALANAINYQKWIYEKVEPFLGKRILEIGAGIGNISRWLPFRERLILTESDPQLLKILEAVLKERRASEPLAQGQEYPVIRKLDVIGDKLDIFSEENLDTIISFNVLEHIEDDRTCLSKLCQLLRESKSEGPKRLVTFVPAHQWAYTEVDRTFGHWRRYSAKRAQELATSVAPEATFTATYFNAPGLLAWLWNGKMLGKVEIGSDSIRAFEKFFPIIRWVDSIVGSLAPRGVGLSLLFVLEWAEGPSTAH